MVGKGEFENNNVINTPSLFVAWRFKTEFQNKNIFNHRDILRETYSCRDLFFVSRKF